MMATGTQRLPGYQATHPLVCPTVARPLPDRCPTATLGIKCHFAFRDELANLTRKLFISSLLTAKEFSCTLPTQSSFIPQQGAEWKGRAQKQDISNTIRNKCIFFISVIWSTKQFVVCMSENQALSSRITSPMFFSLLHALTKLTSSAWIMSTYRYYFKVFIIFYVCIYWCRKFNTERGYLTVCSARLLLS